MVTWWLALGPSDSGCFEYECRTLNTCERCSWSLFAVERKRLGATERSTMKLL